MEYYLAIKSEQIIDTCSHRNELQRHRVSLKEVGVKVLLHGSISIGIPVRTVRDIRLGTEMGVA